MTYRTAPSTHPPSGRTSARTPLGTKSLTITDEAYDRLKGNQREGECFTETILRLTGADREPSKGFGAVRDADGFREAVEETRDELEVAEY